MPVSDIEAPVRLHTLGRYQGNGVLRVIDKGVVVLLSAKDASLCLFVLLQPAATRLIDSRADQVACRRGERIIFVFTSNTPSSKLTRV